MLTRARVAASKATAAQGFDDAEITVPPPPIDTTVYRLQLTRPEPTTEELGHRLVDTLAVMGLQLDPDQALAWAEQTHQDPNSSAATIAEPLPGVVVTYDPWLADLLVVHAALLESGAGQSLDEVPETKAAEVMDELLDRGLVDPTMSFSEPEISYVRSGVRGPDGSHRQWVDEVRFEANAQLYGVPVLDAGVRVGITPNNDVSSLRLTRIDYTPLDPIVIGSSEAALRESFASHVTGTTDAQLETVAVAERRPVYVLDPQSLSGPVEPRYLVRYSLLTNSTDALLGTRSSMVLLEMTSPTPAIDLALP